MKSPRFVKYFYPVIYAVFFSFVGHMLGQDAVFLRTAVALFAVFYWGAYAGLVSAALFVVPALFIPFVTTATLLTLAGVVPAVLAAGSVARSGRYQRTWRLGLAIVCAALLFGIYRFHLRSQPRMLLLPVVMALFCFLYYFARMPHLRHLLTAGLAAVAVNYTLIAQTAFLEGALDRRFFGNALEPTASLIAHLLPADLLVVLIISYLVPVAKELSGAVPVGESQ